MFELHITCTKEIEKLNIDFTDGTCVTTQKKEPKKVSKENVSNDKSNDNSQFEDLSKYNKQTSKTVIEKPIIPEVTETKVDDFLQGLEF